jgi:hypothetical protein
MTRAPWIVTPALLAVWMAGAPIVRTQQPIATFSAQAVNLDAPAGAVTGLVQIQVSRWSTEAEKQQLTTALLEKGEGAMLQTLSKMPTVGTIRTPDSVGYPLRYARHTPVGPAGGEQIVIFTDRPMSFWERRESPRSREYPFTVINLQINSEGRGEGRILLATRILADKVTGDIAYENLGVSPIRLQNVRREQK